MTGETGKGPADPAPVLYGPLQTVADSVRAVTGFEVAAISRLREGKRFEYVVVSSGHEFAQQVLGRGNTLEVIRQQNDNAERWGRFDYVPHDARQAVGGERSWTPDVEYPDAEDAFHPDDVLSSQLHSVAGEVIGMLSLDIPIDGRRPGPEQLTLMEAFAALAERVLQQVVDDEGVQQRLELASTARAIVRRAAATLSIEEVFDACRPLLMEGFDLNGLWMHFNAGSHEPVSRVAAPIEMPGIPEDIAAMAEVAAQVAWAEHRVTVLSATSELTILSEEQRAHVMAYLGELGVGSIIFAPMGSGEESLGNLVLTRPPGARPWTSAELASALEVGRDLGQTLHNANLFARNQALLAELQSLTEYKRALTDSIVHELKNPVTSILGHVEIIDMHDGPDLVQMASKAIDRAARRLTDLTDNLLTLSLVSHVTDMVHEGEVDLVPLVHRAADLLAVRATGKQLKFVIEAPDPGIVTGNRDLLELVCSNLISNAIKYTPAQGSVSVAVSTTPDEVLLTVSDTGIGISEEDRARLFDEFFRASDQQARKESGSGLGLAIVARIVAQHDGTLSVESELGAGSTFTVALPKPAHRRG